LDVGLAPAVYLDETFDYPYLGLLALGLGVAGAYLGWKHWLLTNILSTALALQTLRLLKLDTFTTGMVLLAGLFVYDIFWVFGTDVMVTVAKGFDAPIKIVFPTADYLAATPKLAMLGLGDIIVPGAWGGAVDGLRRRAAASDTAQRAVGGGLEPRSQASSLCWRSVLTAAT